MKEINKGFTLIEVAVSVVVISLIVTTIASFVSFFFNNYDFAFNQGASVSQAKNVLTLFKDYMREATVSNEGAYPLVTADDQEIVFFSDYDNDGDVERLRYYLNGTELNFGVIEPALTDPIYDPVSETVSILNSFVQNGSSPLFYYYNSDWPADSVNNPLVAGNRLLETSLVGISLEINTNVDVQENIMIKSQVSLRNLRRN